VLALQQARAYGLKHAEDLARAYRSARLADGHEALSENAYANYLRRSIRYSLSTKEREGLVEFLTRPATPAWPRSRASRTTTPSTSASPARPPPRPCEWPASRDRRCRSRRS
jgi:hypothetical protein